MNDAGWKAMIEMELARHKRLINYLLTRQQGEATVTPAGLPVVDFFVDMFDRKDSDTLGPYWASTVGGWAIRTKTALLSAGGVIQQPYVFQHASGGHSTTLSTKSTLDGSSRSARPSLYQASLKSSNMQIRITFDGPRSLLEQNGAYATDTVAWAPMFSAGCVFGNSIGNTVGGHLEGFDSPAAAGLSHTRPIDAYFGDVANPTKVWTIMQDGLVPRAFADHANLRDSSLVAAANVMTIEASGSTMTFKLNGTTLYSAANALVVDRNRAGLLAVPWNSLSDAVRLALPYWGVTSIKVWRSDIPEPAAQSGHGTYKDGAAAYIDRYHSPIKDTNTGRITGYTYTPDP